jgi:hypothetical protein
LCLTKQRLVCTADMEASSLLRELMGLLAAKQQQLQQRCQQQQQQRLYVHLLRSCVFLSAAACRASRVTETLLDVLHDLRTMSRIQFKILVEESSCMCTRLQSVSHMLYICHMPCSIVCYMYKEIVITLCRCYINIMQHACSGPQLPVQGALML